MSLATTAKKLKLDLLKMHFDAGIGHIGGNLSCIDILCALFFKVLRPQDEFLLSKGHASGALYVTLASLGKIPPESLKTFHQDGTLLPGHPSTGISQILFSTGSLGHGLPLCMGIALGKQLRGKQARVYCLTSDGEWDEGSNWEALIFGKQKGLSNLSIIVDLNGIQGMGFTSKIADLSPLREKFESFGCDVSEIDGHDLDTLPDLLRVESPDKKIKVILAKTVKGKGVSFMENRFEWHYWPMSKEQYELAIREISENAL